MKRPCLNRRLVLETPARIADGAGGYSETWDALGAVWADVTSRSGRDAASGGVSVSLQAFAVIVRAAPEGSAERPRPDQRFRDGKRILSIQTVAERDLQGRYLTCLVQEEVAV